MAKASKVTSIPYPHGDREFVLGSRPSTIRAPLNIKPGTGDSRMYAKGNPPNAAGVSAGTTGKLM